MPDTAIDVSHISKKYRLGLREETHETLSRQILSQIKKPFSNYQKLKKLNHFKTSQEDDTILALRDISFQVKRGEVLGIIGSNGAGKSTLLKIIAQITEPSAGKIRINGRVASLLEVGTGFHPDLTGRENVYLNGTILGMTKREIDRKFDEIIDFSGVEQFIDTPVKRYSSGMRVRLAFSVAAFLEPEILLIDEVLAVGDNDFQQKCLGKMDDISGQGRTIFFVSHNMPSILRLCTRVILLENGEIANDGVAGDVVDRHLRRDIDIPAEINWEKSKLVPRNEFVRLLSAWVTTSNGEKCQKFDIRDKIGIKFNFEILNSNLPIVPHISLYNDKHELLFNAIDTESFWSSGVSEGKYTSTAWVPGNLLNEGRILVDILLVTFSSQAAIRHIHEEKIISFDIFDYNEGGTARGNFNGMWGGAIRPLLNWTREVPQNKFTEKGRLVPSSNRVKI